MPAAPALVHTILVNPLFDFARTPERGFQLGLLYISTYIKEHGFTCEIIAGESVAFRISAKIKEQNNPVLVGFYVSADNVFEVERCCQYLRAAHPETKIIIGGPQARVSYSPFLENGLADFACIGDGEDCMELLLKKLSLSEDAPKTLSDIPALAYLDSGEVKTSRRLYLSLDLDRFPIPNRHDYEPHLKNFSHICTSRGCVSKCAFCYEGTVNKLKRHSVERVVSEIRHVRKEHATKYFTFVDDTFTTDTKRVLELCERFKNELNPHEDFIWYCECKPSDIRKRPETAAAMVEAGLARAQIGSESGNQHILDAYKKDMSVEDTRFAVDKLCDADVVSIFTNFIVCGALETFSSFENTCEFMVDLMKRAPGVLECGFSYLSPYKGTGVRETPDEFNLELVDTGFITGSSDSYVFARPKDMSNLQVIQMGNIFRELIHSTMSEIYKTLPTSIIRKQIQYSAFGMGTNWLDHILQDSIQHLWRKYYSIGYEPILAMDGQATKESIPVRTFPIDAVINGELDWKLREKKLRFNSIQLRTLELCSGKLNLNSIVDILERQSNSPEEKQWATGSLLTFLQDCADENLLLFRRFS